MYKKDELVGLEKNFAARHFPAVVLLIIYLVVETFQIFSVGAPAFIRAAIVCMVLASRHSELRIFLIVLGLFLS